ncbi:MAG: hypothetical protein OMM_08522, partial [Candidatus Magnetoglobus multicellularis str. Araruama]
MGRIQTTADITIQANDGKIIEHGADQESDIITSGTTKLKASSGIGGDTDQYLELDESCLVDASITSTGDIAIQSSGDLNILSLTTTDGNMDILASNNIELDTIQSAGDVRMM